MPTATLKRYTLKHYRRTLPQVTEAPVLHREETIRAFDQPEAVKKAMSMLADFYSETDYAILSQGGQAIWQMGSART